MEKRVQVRSARRALWGAALLAFAACGAVAAVTAETAAGAVVGWSLFDGKVLLNGNVTGSSPFILSNCPVDGKITTEVVEKPHTVRVKVVFPKAVEPRVQIDYGFGFPARTSVRVTRPREDVMQAEVRAADGTWYFHTEIDKFFNRPGLFADGEVQLFSRDVDGFAPIGVLHECFYAEDGDDIQVKVAWSRKSFAEAERLMRAEIPGYAPTRRPIIGFGLKPGEPEPKPMAGDPAAPSLRYIQRTMKKIAESTREKPATVRVMFYGQSITWQNWNRILMREWQAKYPTVNFVWRNDAIGGYETLMLRDVWKWDVPTFYPDLLFFHDYGDMDQYEEMVRWARERTAAEIVLWTSHISHGKKAEEFYPARDERSRRILEIAAKYHCHVIDLNLKWAKLLMEKKWTCDRLLVDGIHLNTPGVLQYKNFIDEEILRLPGSDGDEAATGRDRVVAVANPEGPVTFAFTGNRVTAISDGTGDAALKAAVLLDGKPMAGRKELWAMTRPSSIMTPLWFPGLHMIDFAACPVDESWKFTVLPPRPGDPTNKVFHATGGVQRLSMVPLRFKVTGSVTGEDGEGISTEPFVSKSGRCVIPVRAFIDMATGSWQGFRPPPGRNCRWRTYPLFTDTWTARETGEETLLLQGCANAAHTLTLRVPKGVRHGIRAFRVWTPAGAAEGSVK